MDKFIGFDIDHKNTVACITQAGQDDCYTKLVSTPRSPLGRNHPPQIAWQRQTGEVARWIVHDASAGLDFRRSRVQ